MRVESAKESDLPAILAIYQANHAENLTEEQAQKYGSVVLEHPIALLRAMMSLEPLLVAKDGETVVGYLLPAPDYYRYIFDEFRRRFEWMDPLLYQGRRLSEHRYVNLAQAAILQAYKGTGVFKLLCEEVRRRYEGKYQLAVTLTVGDNYRSLGAQKKMGFQPLHRVIDEETGELKYAFSYVSWARPRL